ncbi:MAG: hypothetical protein ACRCW1_03850 [Anaerotignaceae bacterium]
MNFFVKIKNGWKKIVLVDKCLIILMSILMLQITYNVFMNVKISGEISSVDIVFRTAAASIFGYFLSANFIKNYKTDTGEQLTEITKVEEGTVTAMEDTDVRENTSPSPVIQKTSDLQIIIATVICIYCLISLAVIRNLSAFYPNFEKTNSVLATGSQFRDFVSGGVGFLIGSLSQEEPKK